MEFFKDFGFWLGMVMFFSAMTSHAWAAIFVSVPFLHAYFVWVSENMMMMLALAAGLMVYSKVWTHRWVLFLTGGVLAVMTLINWIGGFGG